MREVIARLKNINQRFKQSLSGFFPGYIKRLYFKALDNAIFTNTFDSCNVENELLFIGDLIPTDATYIDIGANRGDYVFVLEKSKKCKMIYAVEPIPELNGQLRNLFPGQLVCPEAISDQNGRQKFNIPYISSRYFDTRGTLEHFNEKNQNATRSIDVETITLDDFVKKYQISSVDLIKMDIEGHEFSAMKGANNVMEILRPLWLIEIEQRHHPDVEIHDIFSYIQAYRYNGYYFDGLSRKFNSIQTFDVNKHQQTSRMHNKKEYINNFIFIPEERNAYYQEVLSRITERFS